ncbi:MAG TPA: ester cyclase [candidate division Zixibacteria bacterium]|nr:ester cyclase [candidate division Zixibacteria bacterium]
MIIRISTIVFMLGIIALPFGFEELKAVEKTDMSAQSLAENNKETVAVLFADVLNNGTLNIIGEYVSAEFIGPQGQSGPEGFAIPIKDLRLGFSDIQWTIQEIVAENDKVAVRWTLQGTHDGTYNGIGATGKNVNSSGMAIFKFRDGLIVESTILTDRLGFLQQIGVIPVNLGLTPSTSTAKK